MAVPFACSQNQKHVSNMFPSARQRIHSLAGTAVFYLLQSCHAHSDLAQGIPPPGFLTDSETLKLKNLKTEKRRRDWLLGRWAAKQLLQAVVQQTSGCTFPFDALSIGNGADGAPIVNCQLPIANCQLPGLSISHSNGYAFCAAMAGGGAIGADIERIEPRSQVFVDDYFTVAEKALVAQASGPARDVLVTAIWSAKEAALKALRLGLTVDTRAVSCLIEPAAGLSQSWVSFSITWDQRHLPRRAPALIGWWRTVPGFVLTLVQDPAGLKDLRGL